MEQNTGSNANNPVKDATPRQGRTWWILVLVLLIAGGIFWALGRSNRDAVETAPVGLPVTAPPDQIENTVRAEGHPERTEETLVGDDPAIVRDPENGREDRTTP